jgi:SNF2 family DNA or RNA helicase
MLQSEEQNKVFEDLVSQRMKRFQLLLDNSQFAFKQYQYDGVEWCLRNELRPNPLGNARGGFIADEMGLGKTLMMIGTMFVNFLPRTLIVLPPVLLQQWAKELYKVSGHKPLIYYGNAKKKITIEELMKVPIVLTTYNMVIPKNSMLKLVFWNRIIFDEAHHLRNAKTLRYNSCMQLRGRVRWLVTGTPVQNKKTDFYNLCNAVGMQYSFYTNPLHFGAIGKYFVLRRTKSLVGIDLHDVVKHDCIVPWNNRHEMMLSEEIHSLLPEQTRVSIEKRKKLADVLGPGGALVAILRARQSCILPNLMRQKMELFLNLGFIPSEYLEALESSSKLDAVIQVMVERKDNGKGKIVFCHYRDEIDVIAKRLTIAGFNKVVCYDGRNSTATNLLKLSEPADALIIQIQTGCEGLNLQQNFSEIYFVSPHWNPCVEDQAVARCHRIGQKEPVHVFKFEMSGFAKSDYEKEDPITLEKYVNSVQGLKREASKQILNF